MIGVLSDTHDNIDAIRKAVDFFNIQNVSLVLHAGDFIAPFTAKYFKDLKCKLIGVYGNNDGERKGLEVAYSEIGAEIKEFIEIECSGKKIALYHGTISDFLKALIASEDYDIIVRGHTHTAEIKKEGKTLIINPGEACGYLTGRKTVSLLDLEKTEARIHELI